MNETRPEFELAVRFLDPISIILPRILSSIVNSRCNKQIRKSALSYFSFSLDIFILIRFEERENNYHYKVFVQRTIIVGRKFGVVKVAK